MTQSSGSTTTRTVATVKPTAPKPTSRYPAVNNIRLPKNIVPIQYWFSLDVDMIGLQFTGQNDIEISVTSQTNIIIVHMKQMTLVGSPVVSSTRNFGNPLTISEHNAFALNDYYYIVLASPLNPGIYYVRFNFRAALSTALNGLYKSTYTKLDGRVINIAASQCQPTDARKIIPLFDEPELKANFTATIITQSNYTSVLWNMPIQRNVTIPNRPGFRRYDYNTSVRMSSYLLAFVLADFTYIEMMTKNRVPIRVWATTDTINQGNFALIGGVNITDYFEDFFGIPFPLPKQDMVAVPDFAAGAMENWGLILYRETALLYDPNVSAANNQQRVAYVVAHELAHMWFGNLVTMKWWDDLWLNEGFASFMEYLGTDHYQPTWEMLDQFVPIDVQRAFSLDAFVTSHPVQVTVYHPDEINEVFDTISYAKGASIIRMMRDMMGNLDFKNGISRYLKKFEYRNAVTRDLWQTLSEAISYRINVTDVMDTWTLQMGFPVVTITNTGSQARLSQKRFLLDPNNKNPEVDPATSKFRSPYGYKWNIPLKYILGNSPNTIRSAMVNMSSSKLPWPAGTWLKANKDAYGYYRVNYPVSNWNLLIQEMQKTQPALSKRDFSNLLDDAFNLASLQVLDIAFGTTKYLTKERSYVPWRTANSVLGAIGSIISYRSSYGYFSVSVNDRYPSNLIRLLRMSALTIGCGFGYKPCLDNATLLFRRFMADPTNNAVKPNLKAVVYRFGIANGGIAEWDFLYNYFYKTNVASEKRTILDALSYSKEPWILNRYLRWSIDPAKVRSQDSTVVIGYIANNLVGRPLAWDFVRANWAYIRKTYGGSFFSFGSLIRNTAGRFASQFRLKQANFFRQNPDVGTGANAVKQSVESIKNRISWINSYERVAEDWLKRNV
ncbi:uncharacterized protein TRIADDRAFT_20166 [Trichoplax adhaerens]|uniref:Aminopeptidase n=1 Tax=Trichoplax adhaerens TaxID=10228 RepID=B3RHX4_TRIAD|nr:hypothetical protein TRIADDRAFT_20166 [Trichoplax adhaerens]EDV29668.1 hypothetical protein TRIADDRAFT_20166 [Trichoplax adhaerens]|eukprot:XP_002108870.1 hypothetical protein TRIADDRAFT_20166 [Trichoplax adhaerens]